MNVKSITIQNQIEIGDEFDKCSNHFSNFIIGLRFFAKRLTI